MEPTESSRPMSRQPHLHFTDGETRQGFEVRRVQPQSQLPSTMPPLACGSAHTALPEAPPFLVWKGRPASPPSAQPFWDSQPLSDL